MPIRTWIEKDAGRIRAVVAGDFATADILATIQSAVEHPDFESGFDVLSDHTAIGEPITPSQLESLVDYLENVRRLAGARWAVVTQKPASYGMMRMFSALALRIPIEVEVFATMADAEAWLVSPRG